MIRSIKNNKYYFCLISIMGVDEIVRKIGVSYFLEKPDNAENNTEGIIKKLVGLGYKENMAALVDDFGYVSFVKGNSVIELEPDKGVRFSYERKVDNINKEMIRKVADEAWKILLELPLKKESIKDQLEVQIYDEKTWLEDNVKKAYEPIIRDFCDKGLLEVLGRIREKDLNSEELKLYYRINLKFERHTAILTVNPVKKLDGKIIFFG